MPVTVTKLKQLLKQQNIPNLYLFYGEEKYLRDSYQKQLKDLVVKDDFTGFNYELFEGDTADYDVFTATLEAYPQMAEKKMVVAKNTPFLKSTEYQKGILKLLQDVPEFTVVLFIEDESAKLKKDVLRTIEDKGLAVNFEKQKPEDLRSWVNRRFADNHKKMKIVDMEYLVEICGRSLAKLDLECDKLIAYSGGESVISRSDIDRMVQVPTEYKIYTMVDKLLDKKPEEAYALLAEFKSNKEQPTVILSSIYSQLSMLFMTKKLVAERERIADYLPPNRKFLARKLELNQKNYTVQFLRDRMRECYSYDVGIKTGKIEGFTALELLMASMLQ